MIFTDLYDAIEDCQEIGASYVMYAVDKGYYFVAAFVWEGPNYMVAYEGI